MSKEGASWWLKGRRRAGQAKRSLNAMGSASKWPGGKKLIESGGLFIRTFPTFETPIYHVSKSFTVLKFIFYHFFNL